VTGSGDGASWGTAFKTIQKGINAASNGEAVIVAGGTYTENILFGGKNIILCSTAPLGPTVLATTIIDGNQSGPVVTFSGEENETCVLSGFTIRNGSAPEGAGICGGGWTGHTHATIQNNIISGNSATSSGGGIAYCDGSIQNNLVVGNTSGSVAGGLYDCDGTLQTNTVVANSAFLMGGGLSDCSGTVQNCIIWGNTTALFLDPQISNTFPTYSCIQDWTGGEGNISPPDAGFVDPVAFDYHLLAESPCLDAGMNAAYLPATDLDGNPRIVDGNGDGNSFVDMGAFEYQVPAVPLPDIEVSPTAYDFGNVDVGSAATMAITVTNAGEGSLTLTAITFHQGGSGDFSVTSAPTLPVILPPDIEVQLTYSPSSAGPAGATLQIASDDPGEPTVAVVLTGTGVATEQTPAGQIEEIVEFFDISVEQGSLAGSGPGRSATGRLGALQDMLGLARELIQNGYVEEAYHLLLVVYRRVDGMPNPPDFAGGEATQGLAGLILELMETLRDLM
jgi:hypothetical protein